MEIPKEVKGVIERFQKNNFEAYIVGGCVRDFLLEKKPQDWDIATNAEPEEIQKVFPKTFYKNKFFTVTVQITDKESGIKEVEVTTYRSESKYSDKRHPEEVKFAETLEEDLSRRDFTVNAMAIELKEKTKIIDLFGGKKDLKNKIIRTVGDPQKRFSEDALRMMRAIRFAAQLGFKIEKTTREGIKTNSDSLKIISKERIRDEFLKIIESKKAAEGIDLLRELNLLKHVIPELEEGYKLAQNKHHIYDCYDHSLLSLKYAAENDFNNHVRIASLLHDVGKPRVKRGEGEEATFYNHEVVGAEMTSKILNRLKFSKKDIEKIRKLVRYHLFYYNVDEVGESSVRRLVRGVGKENMNELLQVRMADRIGSGVPKAEPYKLRHLRYLVEKVSRDPISVKMLEVGGEEVIETLDVSPGPEIGKILEILLGYVIDDPEKNNKEFLKNKIKKLGKLSEEELNSLAKKAKEKREKIEIKKDKMTKNKYWVT